MLRFLRVALVVFPAALLAVAAMNKPSAAQTTTPTATTTATAGAPTITISPETSQPDRIVGTQDFGPMERPVQLTPTGISYSDCARDMVLKFPMLVSNIGMNIIQIWAGTSDCSMQANRGQGGVATCWQVAPNVSGQALGPTSALNYSVPISIHVRDIVGRLNTDVSTSFQYMQQGAAACNTQTVANAQSLNVVFVPTTSANTDTGGVSYAWPATIDLVGPEPPVLTSTKAGEGDTFLQAQWPPNVDSDTIGYNIYIDPPPGSEPIGAEPVQHCVDSGAMDSTAASSSSGGDSDVDDAALEASGDDVTDSATEAEASMSKTPTQSTVSDAATVEAGPACTLVIQGAGTTTGAGGVCESSTLTNANTIFASGTTTTTNTTTTDDADVDAATSDDVSDLTDTDAALITGGGISQIDSRYLYAPDSVTHITAGAQTASNVNIKGLVNGVQYNIAIAAVDALGNVGPLSTLECGTPKPVNDFWDLYKGDGGQAGGGFCALEAPGSPASSAVALGGLATIITALWRRRRRSA
ncbi:MAG TPA: hypothetical protein VHV30_17520 [Polyangiaceae bacterium]|jgi:hypothetical protein|nr:hypothetical protein [Polyangiaceae bacterium]